MLSVRHFLTAASLSALISASAFGQSGAVAPERPADATVVTVAATSAGVRFSAPADAVRVQVQVYTDGGQLLFKGSSEGSFFDWQVQDSAGTRLPDGSYLCVVTAETLAGRHERRTAVAAVEGGGVTLRAADAAQARVAGREAAPAAIIAEGETKALTALAHDGSDGQVTSTKGALVRGWSVAGTRPPRCSRRRGG